MFVFLIRPDIRGAKVEESVGLYDDAWTYVEKAMQRRPPCRYLIEKLELYEGAPKLYRIVELLPNGQLVALPPPVEQERVLALTS